MLLLFFKVTLVVQSHIVFLIYSTRSYRFVFYSETLFFWNTEPHSALPIGYSVYVLLYKVTLLNSAHGWNQLSVVTVTWFSGKFQFGFMETAAAVVTLVTNPVFLSSSVDC